MTAQFDEHGDLWIDVDRSTLPADNRAGLRFRAEATFSPSTSGNGFMAVKLNLTDYIRKATQPNWLHAALSSSSADITILGNTPTTGGAGG